MLRRICIGIVLPEGDPRLRWGVRIEDVGLTPEEEAGVVRTESWFERVAEAFASKLVTRKDPPWE